ncbi:hypothetical protein QVD17_20772 [Tagetes erecta]|uniref:RING-type E3 ubiquitin transferase n=1 Tax=Tagetes erecta TaxID=13708 RepID=A0AAD8KLT2_TARER|nr:hypothetical protein QVD17_20772 [Tagetes erecta]
MPEISTPVPEITSDTDTVNEPLLSSSNVTVLSAGVEQTPTRVPMLLGLFSGRRGSSLRVRQNVAMQMEDMQEDWGYSFQVVVITSLWNIAIVVVSVVMLFWIAREQMNLKLRVWICGYLVLCVVHVVMLLLEYKRRNRRISTAMTGPPSLSSSGLSSDDDDRDHVTWIKKCEMINTMASYIWWVFGFVWMLSSYNDNTTPHLFWLTLALLVIDVFFLVLRSLILCLLSVAYCFCLPCIIAFMYYISRQDHTSEADVSNLPKYIFEAANGDVEQPDVRGSRMIPMGPNGPDFSTEGVLLTGDVNCCICLCHYEDGEQLHLLPCNHHFHSKCITKWLRVKATCPLCKSLIA